MADGRDLAWSRVAALVLRTSFAQSDIPCCRLDRSPRVGSTTISIQELTILNPVVSNVVTNSPAQVGVMAITLRGLSALTL